MHSVFDGSGIFSVIELLIITSIVTGLSLVSDDSGDRADVRDDCVVGMFEVFLTDDGFLASVSTAKNRLADWAAGLADERFLGVGLVQ